MLDFLKPGTGLVEREPDPRDFSDDHFLGSDDVLPKNLVKTLPASINLMDGFEHYDQGRTQTCTAQSGAKAMEIQLSAQFGERVYIDPYALWDLQKKYGTADDQRGDFLDSPLKILRKHGVPYRTESGKTGTAKISHYQRIDKDPENMKKWLASGYPILTGSLITATNFRNAGRFPFLWTGRDGARTGGHMYLYTGYDNRNALIYQSGTKYNHKENLTNTNSWGSRWGLKGKFFTEPERVRDTYTAYVMILNPVEEQKPKTKMLFKDLSSNSWAYEATKRNVERKIFEGYSDGTFRPNQPITRAEMSAVIDRTINFLSKD